MRQGDLSMFFPQVSFLPSVTSRCLAVIQVYCLPMIDRLVLRVILRSICFVGGHVILVCRTCLAGWQWQHMFMLHPRAFSFTRDEDALVGALLSSSSLQDIFHLPLPVQALGEVRNLQSLSAEIDPSNGAPNVLRYCWGSTSFLTNRYYSFCFREMSVDAAFN